MAQSTAFFRIGTRGSPLALVQAGMVRSRVAAVAGLSEEGVELVVIRTTGDIIQDRSLAEEGGKGLFTKEIEEALLAGRIDFAVHSAKDMPTILPKGLVLAACLEREDPRDAFISRRARSLGDLPRGASLGTTSPAGKRSRSAPGPICAWNRCVAMSKHDCASSKPARLMQPCWRLRASNGLGWPNVQPTS